MNKRRRSRKKQEFRARVQEWAIKLDVKVVRLYMRPMQRTRAERLHELLHFATPNHGKLWKSRMMAHLGDHERPDFSAILDRGPTVGIIDAQKGTRRPKRRFTGGCPQREISHARRAFKANARQPPQSMGRGVEQNAENPRALHFELAPKLALRAAALVRYWSQGKKDRSVSQI
jgi:hypothetical protein